MSHYFRPGDASDVQKEAMMDWLDALSDLTEQQISDACREWMRENTHRPSPAAIRAKVRRPRPETGGAGHRGDKTKLSHDNLYLLESEILPTAREWAAGSRHSLREHGKRTLEYWGEE